MRNVSHWDRSAGEDQHVGLVILIVLIGAVAFGLFFFWNTSGAFRAPSLDFLTSRGESLVLRPDSGYQPGTQSTDAAQTQPAAPQAQATVDAQPTAAAAQAQQGQAQPTAQATPAADNAVAHIARTDGEGVVLRASPNDSDRTPRGFMDGTQVTVVQRQGSDWALVRGANGQEGWIPTKYLDQ
jgi:hypothetical protein